MEGWTTLHVESPPAASGFLEVLLPAGRKADPPRLGASPPAGLSPAADKGAIYLLRLRGQIPPFIMTVCCPVKLCSRFDVGAMLTSAKGLSHAGATLPVSRL